MKGREGKGEIYREAWRADTVEEVWQKRADEEENVRGVGKTDKHYYARLASTLPQLKANYVIVRTVVLCCGAAP